MPVEAGGNLSAGKEDNRSSTTKTAAGIVFAYRLHVIRPKKEDVEVELFSDRVAFFSGEAKAAEAEEELELVGVDYKIVQEDLELEEDVFEERKLQEGDEESFVIAKGG